MARVKKEVWYRDKQVEEISEKLRIPKTDIELILRNYTIYLQEQVNKGKTVKVLNMCYLKNLMGEDEKLETLAYISTEIAKTSRMGKVTIFRVLTTLEDIIVKDLCNNIAFSLRGLIRVRVINDNGAARVHIKKSTKYNGEPITVVTLNAFRRRVAAYNAR